MGSTEWADRLSYSVYSVLAFGLYMLIVPSTDVGVLLQSLPEQLFAFQSSITDLYFLSQSTYSHSSDVGLDAAFSPRPLHTHHHNRAGVSLQPIFDISQSITQSSNHYGDKRSLV